MHGKSVIAGQMLTSQRRAKILIPGLDLFQYCSSKLRRVSPVRYPPTVAMLQPLRSAHPIPRPHPLALPITQPQHLRRLAQSQTVRLHPPHHFHSAQLFLAQSRSPQSRFLLVGGTLKGTLLMWSRGDTFNVVQHDSRQRLAEGHLPSVFSRSNRAICANGGWNSGPLRLLPIEGVFDCRPLLDSEKGFWGPTRVSAWRTPCALCFVVCAFQSYLLCLPMPSVGQSAPPAADTLATAAFPLAPKRIEPGAVRGTRGDQLLEVQPV